MKFVAFYKHRSTICSVCLEKTGESTQILDKKTFDLPTQRASLLHYIQFLKHTEPSIAFITALDAKEISLKQGKLPKARGKEWQALLTYELEKHNVFLETSSVTVPIYNKFSKEASMQEVFFLTCSKKTLEEHINSWEELNICPDGITTVPSALYRFCRSCISAKDFLVVAIYHGVAWLLLAINDQMTKICEISLEIEPVDSARFWQTCDKFLFRCFADLKIDTLDVVFLNAELVQDKFCKLLQAQHQIMPVIQELDALQDKSAIQYCIPWGMCLDAALEDKKSVNFLGRSLQKATTFTLQTKKQLKHFVFSITALTAACLCASSCFFSYKNHQLDCKVTQLIQEMLGEDKVTKVSLKDKSLEEKIIFCEKQLRLLKKNALALPNFSVTKILKDFENFVKKEKLQGHLANISYQMISYPTAESKKQPYEALVVLEFIMDAAGEMKQPHIPSYWTKFNMEKKPYGYEISFVAK